MRYYEKERREFVRVSVEVPVSYRFLSHDAAFKAPETYEGVTQDLSGGGLLLQAKVPDPDWIPGLLTEHIFFGVEIRLPGCAEPVRALTRASWVQSAKGEENACLVGLRFKEITRKDMDSVFKFVIGKKLA
jgi:c-di-GMP-binding flagellar brake protein YcgR